MSLEELEEQVRQLRTPDLVKFAEWFDVYREASVLAGDEVAGDLPAAQREEGLRRQSEYRANPAIATAWNDGFFDRLRQRLVDVRAKFRVIDTPQSACSRILANSSWVSVT